jgi:hypothetical protein
VNAAIAIASAAVPTVAGTLTLSCATPPMVHDRLVDLEQSVLDDGLALVRLNVPLPMGSVQVRATPCPS